MAIGEPQPGPSQPGPSQPGGAPVAGPFIAEPRGEHLPASLAMLPARRERLAIVSTRNRLCGIAAYTKALERQLGDLFEVSVFDLDQYLLRSPNPRVRALGDRHIREICEQIRGFDGVNLQLEHGTLGRSANDIYRRFCWLVAAAPRLCVTFHTLKRAPVFPLSAAVKAAAMLRWGKVFRLVGNFSNGVKLSDGIARRLRQAQKRIPLSVIVHNRRDRDDARHVHGFERVFDHPLSFLSPAERDAIAAGATRRRFSLLDRLAPDAVLVGVFGFLNHYKGCETAIQALHHLPENHHLLIFGGTHPNEVAERRAIHPYVAELLARANAGTILFDQLRGAGQSAVNLNLDVTQHLAALFGRHPRDLSHRVHFMGVLDDADFLAGMAICDIVVFPYLEVGQSASGPLSQAVELGCRVIASTTHTFREFARYHPRTIEFFEIGNHLELAKRIAARPQYAERPLPRYNVDTNRAVYLAANSAPENGGPEDSSRAAVKFADGRRRPDAAAMPARGAAD